jgi:hypothetical protein
VHQGKISILVVLLLLLQSLPSFLFSTLGSSNHIPGNVALSVAHDYKPVNALLLNRISTTDLPGRVYEFGAFDLAHRSPLHFGRLW